MITLLSNQSWIEQLDVIDAPSYEARATRTIEKIVNTILSDVSDKVTEEVGEFMISSTAQSALETTYEHSLIPLAELLKEKVTGNPAFDFHTESPSKLIAFGEAKFSGVRTSTYTLAMKQIGDFIILKKDVAEVADLRRFTTKEAATKAVTGEKAFTAAFSINAKNPQKIFDNAIKHELILPLLSHEELYLIGIEINA